MIANKIRRLWGAKRFFNEVLLGIALFIVTFNYGISHFLKMEGLWFFFLKLVILVCALSYIYVILKKYKEAVNNKIIYQSIADCSQEALIVFNASGKFIYHNPVAEGLYSIMKDLPSSYFASLSANSAKGREFQISNSVNKTVIFYYVSSIVDPSGTVIGSIISAPNMTEKKSEYDQLRKKQIEMEHAQQIAHIGNWEMDLSSREITGSKEFYRICGISSDSELSEERIREAIHPDDIEDFYAEVEAAREDRRPFEFVGRMVRAHGELRHIFAQGIWLLNEADECTHVFGVVEDITEQKKTEMELLQTRTILQKTLDRLNIVLWERKEYEEKNRHLAFYDSLTGLFNRRYFAEQFNVCINEASLANQKLALVFIDLDQFRWVNDSLGHDVGDQLLIEVTNLMRSCIGEGGVLARSGGDEFTILLKNVSSEEEALNMARCVMDALQAPVSLLGHEFRVTASIGVSLYPDHGYTVNEMMKHADSAMYQVKEEGRNAVKVYHPSSDHSTYGRFYLQTQLHQALAEDQFVLHYQPRFELKTGTIQSVEALIRWDHPVMGIIPPNVFISLAEQSGFIVPLGEWVLREACRQNKAWRDRGLPALRIAVNVSAQQFHQDSFVSRVADILSETGLSPESLEVEITESALMNHEKRIIAKLQQLNQMGIHVSIDDFGTGYSSLNYLKSFDVKALKIDRSFIRDLFEDAKDAAITKMIISLAHNLQLEVIGEGVETEHQHEFLLHNGCEHAQGFLYCRPLSADMMTQKLKENLMTLSIGENNP